MKKISIKNIEDLVFYDRKLQNELPDKFFSIFEQWRLSQRVPHLRQIGKQAVLDLLNNLQEEDVKIIEKYFKEDVYIEKINSNIVETQDFEIKNLSDAILEDLNSNMSGKKSFSVWRDKDKVYVTFYR